MSDPAKAAADVAALYPIDSPLARIGREQLAELAAEEAVNISDSSPAVVVGNRLRDAAVDPRPTDFLPPTNAGKPGPEGNSTLSPQMLTRLSS